MAKKRLGPTEHTTVPPPMAAPIVDVVAMKSAPFSKSMPCPVPGHNGACEVIHTNGRDYAVCHCPGASKHYGQVVWESIR